MKFTGKLADASIDFVSGKTRLALEINEKDDFSEGFDELKNAENLAIELKPYRPKRSLDANAYAWTLIGKIAAAVGAKKTEIYRRYIKEVGDNFEVVCLLDSAVGRMKEIWCRNGIGWQTETEESKLQGCTNMYLYYGSSTYDSKQMSRLIDLIVYDCKSLGIQTETPDKIAELKALWGSE